MPEEININLLIVDDDLIFNQLVHSFVSSQGVNAESVYSVAEAREYLQSHKPDFIILDYMLKDGMGVELMEDIKYLKLTMPVMMVTGEEDQETMRECFELGVDDYLLKPLNFELLWLKLQRLYSAHQLQLKVAQQATTVQSLLDEKEDEEQLARHVYEHMVNQEFNADHFVHSLLKSSSAFNGDTFIVCKAPTGNICMILLDATGHGLAAAISILPVASLFQSLVARGLELSSILFELNYKLGTSIPDDRFVAAIAIEFDASNSRLNIWNGGMPEVLMMDNKGVLVGESRSTNLPLGILDKDDFDASVQSYEVSRGGHLVFCSDGLLEQENAEKQDYGMPKLKALLAESTPENFIHDIEASFAEFLGEEIQLDDVSICHLDINQLLNKSYNESQVQTTKNGHVQLNLNIHGALLEHFDVMGNIQSFMKEADVPIELQQKTFTVCTELIVNAIEHGVLKLESSMKEQENGFAQFYELREARMQALTPGDGIKVAMIYDSQKVEVSFRVWDSGDGYDIGKATSGSNSELSGRGVALIHRLSSKIHYAKDKNQTSVIIK
ncbi:SpoIIE family protein phosphatase [Paraglaciecola sp.]|uniref:SpoIIE family protein phosphatase n=1 Tax=Paraglaciecola sp. TaxID=1920173 RepID=UPI003EFA39BF